MAADLSLTDAIVIVIMVLIVLMFLRQRYGEVTYVRSEVDGRRYLVRKLPDSAAAADRLAQLNATLTEIVRHVTAKFPGRADVQRLYANFDPDAVSEGGMEHGYTSYSVNKGEKIVMCIRQKDNTFVAHNVLVYVATHELAHIMTREVGHTDTFWANFRFLLQQAVEIGQYKVQDFAKNPQPYCGIEITSSVV